MKAHTPKPTTSLLLLLVVATLMISLLSAGASINIHAAESTSAPHTNSWSPAAAMPTHRWQFGVAVVDGKVYAVGGMADSREGPTRLNTTEEFDLATNIWTTKQSMPFPSMPFSSFPFGVTACNGEIYAFGLVNNSEPIVLAMEVYNPQTDKWETKTPMPINATTETIVEANAVNGKIYVMGNAANGLVNEVYDPDADSWTAKSVPANGQIARVSVPLDNKIYFLGGEANGGKATFFQAYDTQSDSWSTLTPLPSTMSYGAAASTTGLEAPKRIYAFGSFVGIYSGSFTYDPASESWLAFSGVPESVEFFEVANVNDQIYLMGGIIPPFISGYPNQTLVYTPFGYGGAPIPTPKPSPTLTSPSTPIPSTSPTPRSPPIVNWLKIYTQGQSQAAIQTSDGGYLIAGPTLIKTDADGNGQWNTDLNGTIQIISVIQTGDGDYVAGGIGAGNAPNSFALVKTDSSGNVIWNKTYPSIFAGVGEDDLFTNLFGTSDGGFVLAGTMNAYSGAHKPSYPWLLKADSNGNIVWSQTYAGGDMLTTTNTSDGGYAFLTPSPIGGLLLSKVDSSGQMEWNQSYPNWPKARSLTQASDGGFALATGVEGGFWLGKTDWLGKMQWNQTYAAPGNGTVNWAFTRTSDSGCAFVGSTNVDSSAPNASGVRVWVLKTDSDGNAQWNQTYGGPSGTEGRAIIQTRDGGFAVAGQVNHYQEVDTNWPPFVCLFKLVYPTQSSSPLPIVLVVAAVVAVLVSVVVVAVVLRRRTENRFRSW